MILYAERWRIDQFKAAVAAVKQADMRCAGIRGQCLGVHREAVVHACNLDGTVAQPFDRVVRAAMALVHLHRLRAHRQPEHLVAKANTEQRLARCEPLTDYRHRIFARRGGIAGPVGEEQPVGVMRHDVIKTGGGGNCDYFASNIN